jgi:hypothetical protein
LVSKRQKLEEYKSKLCGESKRRSIVLSSAREAERRGRESRQARVCDIEKARLITGTREIPQSSSPLDLLQLVDNDYMLQKIPRLISEHVKSLQNHAIDLQNQTALLIQKKQALTELIDSFNQKGTIIS